MLNDAAHIALTEMSVRLFETEFIWIISNADRRIAALALVRFHGIQGALDLRLFKLCREPRDVKDLSCHGRGKGDGCHGQTDLAGWTLSVRGGRVDRPAVSIQRDLAQPV